MLWVDFWTSKKVIDRGASQYSLPPTLKSSYDEPAVKKALPYSGPLLKAIENATTRPVSPVYSQISRGRLQERQCGDERLDESRGGAEEGPVADRERAEHVLMAPVELLIAGAGSRGWTYADWAARHPDRARVVAVAEPRDTYRERLADAHGVPEEGASATGARPRPPAGSPTRWWSPRSTASTPSPRWRSPARATRC